MNKTKAAISSLADRGAAYYSGTNAGVFAFHNEGGPTRFAPFVKTKIEKWFQLLSN